MDAILGFIHANAVLIGFGWGLLVKYVPALKGIPNLLIPYINTLVAFLTGIAGPATAGAAVLGLSVNFGGGIVGHLLSAGWSAVQSALIYEVFARHPIRAAQKI